MPNSQTSQEVDSLVSHKVKKRVAKKVMRDIHQQVGEIEQQVLVEKKTAKLMLPLLFLLAALILLLFANWADFMRLLSSMIYY